MMVRLAAIALMAALLAGCNTFNCGAASQNTQAAGGCSAHTTF